MTPSFFHHRFGSIHSSNEIISKFLHAIELVLHDTLKLKSRLGRSCDCHHILSVQHGSVISSKSPSEGQRALSRGNSKYAPLKKPLQLNKKI